MSTETTPDHTATPAELERKCALCDVPASHVRAMVLATNGRGFCSVCLEGCIENLSKALKCTPGKVFYALKDDREAYAKAQAKALAKQIKTNEIVEVTNPAPLSGEN